MTKFDKSKLPSRHVSVGPERAPHRSYYYAMGLGEADIGQAGRRAQAEQKRVRPAIDVDAIGVVGVERDVGLEEIARAIGRGS